MIAKDLTVVMYHYVRDLKNSRYPFIKGLDIKLFNEQINFLENNYNFVNVEQVIAAYNQEEKLPPKPVLLTFDDAYIDHFTFVFPILNKKKIQGAFYPPVKAVTEHIILDVNKIHFILAKTTNVSILLKAIENILEKYRNAYNLNSFSYYFKKLAFCNRFDSKEIIFIKRLLQVELNENIRKIITNELFEQFVGIEETAFSRELYMTTDQIKCMSDYGMHIGSHGYNHEWLSSLTKDKQEYEIKKSIEFIESVGGDLNNWTISYPYGNYNEITLNLLKEYKCKLGFTTDVDLAFSSNCIYPEIFKIPRLDTNDLPSKASSSPNHWFRKVR